MADKNWLNAVTETFAKRTISITGALAIATGAWMILIVALYKKPVEFLASQHTFYGIQLMAIGGIAQHTKGLRQKED